VLLCAILILLGIAVAMAMAPLMSEAAVCGMVLEAESGGSAFAQAFGLTTCAFAAGCVVGPVWGGLVLARLGMYSSSF